MDLAAVQQALAREMLGEPELTPHDVAAAAGVDLETARRLWRALGFPPVPDDDRIFTGADAETLRAVRELATRRIVEPNALIQLARVLGQSLARVAEAQVAAAETMLADLLRAAEGGDGCATLATELTTMLRGLEPFLGYVWRRHLLAAVGRLAGAGSPTDGGARVHAVGFADLVGFTAFSQRLAARELAALVDRFEALAYEQVAERGGRVIKMIGDEVMFVAESAAASAEIAVALKEACTADETLPDLRVGIALGPTLSWEGDLFGPTVNLASRLVGFARPGSVLASEELAKQLETHPTLLARALRSVTLQGIGRVRPWVIRRRPAQVADAEAPAVGGRRRRLRAGLRTDAR